MLKAKNVESGDDDGHHNDDYYYYDVQENLVRGVGWVEGEAEEDRLKIQINSWKQPLSSDEDDDVDEDSDQHNGC